MAERPAKPFTATASVTPPATPSPAEPSQALRALPLALQESLLDRAPPLLVAAVDGQVLFANAAYRRLGEQLDGLEAATLPATEELSEARRAGRPVRRDHRIIVDDKVCNYRAAYELVADPAGEAGHVVARYELQDEAQQLNAALTLARERLDDVSRLVSDWIWEVDRELAFRFVSPRITEVLGYHPMELIGRPWGSLVQENDPLGTPDPAQGLPRFRDHEVTIAARDGSPRLFRLCGVPVFDTPSGQFAGYRGTAQDVTELKAREAAVLEAKATAEEANRTKSQFLANMSHELRTPLNAVIGFADMMRAEALGPLGHDSYRDYARDIAESGRHLLQLINNVLDVAKIESGRLELQEEIVDPGEIAHRAVRRLAPQAESAGLDVVLDMPPEPGLLRADGLKLSQIFNNLLANAVKFTEPEGRVVLRLHPPTADHGMRIEVTDTGIGMSPQEVTTALTPFGQVDSDLGRRYEGTGLGLPLARSLVDMHGGTLTVDSAPGEGTAVRISLPAERWLPG